MRRIGRLLLRGALGLVASTAVVVVVVATTGVGQRSVAALRALLALQAHISGQHAAATPTSLQRGTVTRTLHRYSGTHGDWEADHYRPEQPASAGLVIVPGAAPDGRNDPRLVDFALLFADAGFEVLIPEIGNLRRMRLGATDIDAIADAMVQLSELRRSATTDDTPQPVGVVAVSYAVGPTSIALTRPEVGDRVGLMVGIGGYHDIANVVAFFTTDKIRDGDRWRPGKANRYGRWVFAGANADRLRDRRDRILLSEIARLRWNQPDAPVADLIERLGPDGRAVMALLENRDPRRVAALIAALPPSIKTELKALDPSGTDLSGIKAHGLLVHGRGDTIIPYTESKALARAWPQDRITLHILEDFRHVDGAALPLGDIWSMFQAVYSVMAFRDRPRPPGK